MRSLVALAAAVAAMVVIGAVMLQLMKRSTLFFPMRYPAGDWDGERLPVRPVDHWFESADGTRLHGWLIAREAGAPLLVWCHGNGGNVTHRAEIAAGLALRGVNVFLFDWRGYGRSDGSPQEKKLYDDAVAAYDYVVSRGIAPAARVIPYGESLGGPYAAHIAAVRPARGVILESTFHSAADLANRILPLPVGALLGNSLNTAKLIARADAEVLVAHGDEDRTIPVATALRLYESIRAPKELFLAKGIDHNEIAYHSEYYSRVTGFSRRVAGLSSSGEDGAGDQARTSHSHGAHGRKE